MKNRFSSDNRTTWRQRFLAISREAAPVHRREPTRAGWGVRARLTAPRSLRGIRLGCVRAA